MHCLHPSTGDLARLEVGNRVHLATLILNLKSLTESRRTGAEKGTPSAVSIPNWWKKWAANTS